GARVRFCAVQQAGDGVYNFAQRAARVEGGGRVEWMLAEFGGRLTRSSFVSLLVGSGAASEARAVFLAGGRQHMDLVGQHVHCSDHTESDMTVRGVLGDRARSVFRGLIQIDKGARESSAHQREQTLLLSERARTDAIPSLIIDENAVRAGHAATTGPIDREQVFYMMSRGLTEQQATRLIVEGFFAPVVEGIPVDAVRKAVAERMEAYFGG
ncbi:MAG: SufD family Fe-S cluster assembly protein, partial [Clostridia bacterium]|nr:SufD family Fe-S cluster assembly protein [Clostridia bacterium]